MGGQPPLHINYPDGWSRHAVCTWSYQTFVEGRVTRLRTRTTSTPHVGRLKLLGADAAKAAMPTGTIVERIDVVRDVRQRDVTARLETTFSS